MEEQLSQWAEKQINSLWEHQALLPQTPGHGQRDIPGTSTSQHHKQMDLVRKRKRTEGQGCLQSHPHKEQGVLSLNHQDQTFSLPRDFPHRFPQQNSKNLSHKLSLCSCSFKTLPTLSTTGECFTTVSKASGKELNHSCSRAGRILHPLPTWCHFQDGMWPLEIQNYIGGGAKIKL